MRLAERLGKTLKELMDGMGDGELDLWLAKDRLEAGGQFREDLRAAIVASTIANCHLGRDSSPFRASDFMPPEPSLSGVPEFPSEEEVAAKVRAVFGVG